MIVASWMICLELYTGYYRLTEVQLVVGGDEIESILDVGRHKDDPDWFFPVTRGGEWTCD